jgi:hypothetical protein
MHRWTNRVELEMESGVEHQKGQLGNRSCANHTAKKVFSKQNRGFRHILEMASLITFP